MTLRRDFLAFTAGAVAAKTVLPIGARAAPLPSHPDAALLGVIGRFMELEREYMDLFDDPSSIEDDHAHDLAADRIAEAQDPLLDALCSLRATTAEGIKARALCLLLADQEMDPEQDAEDHPEQRGRMLGALLRDVVQAERGLS